MIPYIVYILSYVYFWVQKILQICCTHAVCKESAEIQEILKKKNFSSANLGLWCDTGIFAKA